MPSAFEFISFQLIDDVAVIKMNDPASLNAASIVMVEEFIAAFGEAAACARAIVVSGEGRGFCAGAKLGGEFDPNDGNYDAGLALETHFNPLMRTIRMLPIPLVTAVNGPAAGIGATIALAGDMIVAAESAYFLQAFARIGLVPDGGSAVFLINAAGRPRAMQMMMLGERVSARQAMEWGLVNYVVEDAELMNEALVLASRLAKGPTATLGMIRRIAWKAMEDIFENSLVLERECQREAGLTQDHREGVAAFLAKRPAVFTGS